MYGGLIFFSIFRLESFKKQMKHVLLLLIAFGGVAFANSQKVFSVTYESQSDVKVFVVDYESQADLNVYKVSYESQAGQNDGKWFFTEYESQAKRRYILSITKVRRI